MEVSSYNWIDEGVLWNKKNLSHICIHCIHQQYDHFSYAIPSECSFFCVWKRNFTILCRHLKEELISNCTRRSMNPPFFQMQNVFELVYGRKFLSIEKRDFFFLHLCFWKNVLDYNYHILYFITRTVHYFEKICWLKTWSQ